VRHRARRPRDLAARPRSRARRHPGGDLLGGVPSPDDLDRLACDRPRPRLADDPGGSRGNSGRRASARRPGPGGVPPCGRYPAAHLLRLPAARPSSAPARLGRAACRCGGGVCGRRPGRSRRALGAPPYGLGDPSRLEQGRTPRPVPKLQSRHSRRGAGLAGGRGPAHRRGRQAGARRAAGDPGRIVARRGRLPAAQPSRIRPGRACPPGALGRVPGLDESRAAL
ncbi:MAG: hypothetical protein AVDCRST_MAG90-2496, partial [uncultured Microvirga sp.]